MTYKMSLIYLNEPVSKLLRKLASGILVDFHNPQLHLMSLKSTKASWLYSYSYRFVTYIANIDFNRNMAEVISYVGLTLL